VYLNELNAVVEEDGFKPNMGYALAPEQYLALHGYL
jgi:hypothetical protein